MSFQIKDHFRLMRPLSTSLFHIDLLTFSFLITFIMNYAIFNLQLLVS